MNWVCHHDSSGVWQHMRLGTVKWGSCRLYDIGMEISEMKFGYWSEQFGDTCFLSITNQLNYRCETRRGAPLSQLMVAYSDFKVTSWPGSFQPQPVFFIRLQLNFLGHLNRIFRRACACSSAKGSCSFYESGAAEQLAWRYLNANACGCSIGMALAIYDWFLLTTFLHTSGLMISYSKTFLTVTVMLSFNKKPTYTWFVTSY